MQQFLGTPQYHVMFWSDLEAKRESVVNLVCQLLLYCTGLYEKCHRKVSTSVILVRNYFNLASQVNEILFCPVKQTTHVKKRK